MKDFEKVELLQNLKKNIKTLLDEASQLINHLSDKDYEKTKNFIKKTQYLFKGAAGVRHVDFVAYKNK